MGSGASTSTTKVERIRIDDNGDIWKKKKDGSEKLCRPLTGSRPLSGIQKRIRNRSSSIHSTKSKENNNESNENNINSNLKKIQTENEQLKHELRRMEQENRDLMNENEFYKSQHTESDEYFDDQEGNANVMKTRLKMDQNLYENLVEKLQNELREQQKRYEKRLEFERELREKMEDVVRIHLGDAFLYDAKNTFARDTLPIVKPFESVKPFCRNLLSSHGRLSSAGNTSTNFVQPIKEENPQDRSNSQTEIITIHDDEPSSKIRPSTADIHTVTFTSPIRIGRGESAPTLFKLSKSREKRSQWRKKKGDGDKESIESLDEEIDEILSGSFSSLSTSIGSNKRRSAKSRDSGYLGESANFETESKLDALNLP